MIIDHPATVYAAPEAQLLLGDTRTVLAALPDASVDMICTSPPYFAVRDYGTGQWVGGRPRCAHGYAPTLAATRRSGATRKCLTCGAVWVDQQYGLETNPQAYVDNMRAVFDDARRVLHPEGTLWLNLGDSYASGELGRNDAARRYPSLAAHQPNRDDCAAPTRTGLARKNLLGMPWRTALALQDSGWILRNAIVWSKANPLPTSVRDRLSNTHEMIFLFSRSTRYFFDLDAIRVPHLTAGLRVAALQLGRRYVGIDLNPAYHDLAAQRLTQPALGASRRGDEDPRFRLLETSKTGSISPTLALRHPQWGRTLPPDRAHPSFTSFRMTPTRSSSGLTWS